MSNPSIEESLRALTKTEAKVLYYKCLGLRRWEIAEEIQYGEDMVQVHMSNVYRKLGFDASMHWQERKKLLEQAYCPVLNKMVLDPQELENWPPDLPEIQPDNKALILVMQDDIEEEKEYREEQDRRELEKVSQSVIKITSPSQPPRPRRRWILLLILLLILAAGAYWASQNIPTLLSILNPEQTQEVAGAVPTDSPVVEPDNIRPPHTALSGATNNPTTEPSPTITLTLEPTSTSTITLTPEPTITPTTAQKVLLYDDFSLDNQGWEIIIGNPFWSNGQLIADEETWVTRGDLGWTSYKVTVNAFTKNTACGNEKMPNIIALRMNGADNMVAFRMDACHCVTYIVKDNNWTRVPNSDFNPGGGLLNYVLTVSENEYTVSVNGLKYLTFFDDTFTHGKIGIVLWGGAYVDDILVEELP